MNLPLTPEIRARHEAGHVAMFLHLGLSIDFVTIAGDEGKTFPLADPVRTHWQTVLIDLAGSIAAPHQPFGLVNTTHRLPTRPRAASRASEGCLPTSYKTRA